MRTYEELNEAEQKSAVDLALNDLLQAIVEGGLRFNDDLNHDNLQAAIDEAGEEADRNQTPWFTNEFIMEATFQYEYDLDGKTEDENIGEHLRGMAVCDAEDALYPGLHEKVLRLPREVTTE